MSNENLLINDADLQNTSLSGLERTVSSTSSKMIGPIIPLDPHHGTGLAEYTNYDLSNMNQDNKETKIYYGKSIFMLCSIALGVGVFVLPGLFNTTGIVVGILMLIGFAAMSGYTR
eukprot:208501_1